MSRIAPVVLALAAAVPAHGRLLRNDTAAPGAQIAFFGGLSGEDGFGAVLDVPDDLPVYRICTLFAWIGPNDFNIFTIRLSAMGDGDQVEGLIWDSDLDAYQLFGSRNQLNAIDLAGSDVVSDARRFRVWMEHVPGAGAPPTIASDADGITPGHNYVSFLQRNGQYYFDRTENMPDDAALARPPGDWILRAEVVAVDEICPDDGAVLPDGGPPPPPPPDGSPPPPPPRDGGPADPDAAAPPRPDARVVEPPSDEDAGVVPPDAGAPRPGELAIERIVPDRGPPDRNTEVVINGAGFPFGAAVRATLGDARLLETTVLSSSTITAIVPAGLPPGTYALSIARADGQVAILPDAFTVTGATLKVARVQPEVIAADDRAVLVVDGDGFDAATTFRAGAVVLEAVVVESPQRALGRLGTTLPPGRYDVVAASGASEARLEGALTVVEATGGGGGAASDGCRGTDATGSTPAALLLLAAFGVRRRRAGR